MPKQIVKVLSHFRLQDEMQDVSCPLFFIYPILPTDFLRQEPFSTSSDLRRHSDFSGPRTLEPIPAKRSTS